MPSPLQEGFLTTGSVWEERNCWFWTPPAWDKPVLPYLRPWCKIAFSTKKVHTGRNHRRSSFCVGPKGISLLFGRLLGRAFQSQWFPVLLPTCQQTSSLTQRGPAPGASSTTRLCNTPSAASMGAQCWAMARRCKTSLGMKTSSIYRPLMRLDECFQRAFWKGSRLAVLKADQGKLVCYLASQLCPARSIR